MATTEEEKKIARAYNVGMILSTYEPRLLEKIIKSSKNNEFVKVMAIAKEHDEFLKNIPKKEFSKEYRNGFNNARFLAEHEPELLDNIITTKNASNDFLNGLKAGKKEYHIKETNRRVKQEQLAKKNSKQEPDAEKSFGKGFDYGYKYSKNDPEFLKEFLANNKEWNVFVDGINAGKNQHLKESKLDKSHGNSKINPSEHQKGFNAGYLISKHIPDLSAKLNKIQNGHSAIIGFNDGKEQLQSEQFNEHLPSWLKTDPFIKNDKIQEKDKDIEPER